MNNLNVFAKNYIIKQTVEAFPVKNLSKETLLIILAEIVNHLLDYPKLINKIATISLKKYKSIFLKDKMYILLKKDEKILGLVNNKVLIIDGDIKCYYKSQNFDKLQEDLKDNFLNEVNIKNILIKALLKLKKDFDKNDESHQGFPFPAEKAQWMIINIFKRIQF